MSFSCIFSCNWVSSSAGAVSDNIITRVLQFPHNYVQEHVIMYNSSIWSTDYSTDVNDGASFHNCRSLTSITDMPLCSPVVKRFDDEWFGRVDIQIPHWELLQPVLPVSIV